MNLFNQKRPTTQPEHIRQLKTWTQDVLNLPDDVPISISQLQCHEPGCPPIETVIAVMTQPPQSFKIHRAAGEITYADVQQSITPSAAETAD